MEKPFEDVKKFILQTLDMQIDDSEYWHNSEEVAKLKSVRKKVEKLEPLALIQVVLRREEPEIYLSIMKYIADDYPNPNENL